jgi:membrane-associated HD superfamily phosphohydrolase
MWFLWRKSSCELQEMHSLYPPLQLEQYTPPAQIKHTLYTQPRVTCAQITEQNSYSPTNVEQEPHTNEPHQQTSKIQDLKIS